MIKPTFECDYVFNEEGHPRLGEECGLMFASFRQLTGHMRWAHDLTSRIWQIVKTNQCPYCRTTHQKKGGTVDHVVEKDRDKRGGASRENRRPSLGGVSATGSAGWGLEQRRLAAQRRQSSPHREGQGERPQEAGAGSSITSTGTAAKRTSGQGPRHHHPPSQVGATNKSRAQTPRGMSLGYMPRALLLGSSTGGEDGGEELFGKVVGKGQ